MFLIHPFELKLKSLLSLNRRAIPFKETLLYSGKLLSISDTHNNSGYGEVIYSEKFAQELAYLHLILQKQSFSFKIPASIPIAAMLNAPDLKEAKILCSQGFQTLKFKVGKNWALEAESLAEIRYQIGHHIAIRLDANQSFDLSTAIEFGKRIAPLKITYFEEPCSNIHEIPQFVQATGIPVALDESLIPITQVHTLEGISTYALKPFLMPDLQSILNTLSEAHKHKIDIAICSAFESGYSLCWLVLLAALIQDKLIPAGLSTYRWFQEDLINPPFQVSTGHASVSRALDILTMSAKSGLMLKN